MKRISIIFFVLVLAGGGGAWALIMLGIIPNPFSPQMKPMTTAEAAAAKAEASRKVFEPPDSAMAFVDLRDMIFLLC